MDFQEIMDILWREGEIYARNLAVPLTITLIIALTFMRSIRSYAGAQLRTKHRDQIIDELLLLSHTYSEFLDMFHIRAKFDPTKIDTMSETLTMKISTLGGLTAVYFAKTKDIRKFKDTLNEFKKLYNKLVVKKEPFTPVSPTEYVTFQEDFSEIITELTKIMRSSKMI